MRVLDNEPLARHTTLGVGGPARSLIEIESEAELIEVLRRIDTSNEPFSLLGGGSNVVVSDRGVAHLVLKIAISGLKFHDGSDEVLLTAAAGEEWDRLVAQCVERGLSGIECLSGIPGLVGAAPVQNIGAYGQDLSQVLVSVRAFDRACNRIIDIPVSRCLLGYRDSLFKRLPNRRRYLVTALTLRLRRAAPRRIAYVELQRALGSKQPSVAQVRAAVLRLRRGKGMVVDPGDLDSHSAGSFFVNPVVSNDRADAIEGCAWALGLLAPEQRLPRFVGTDEQTKIPAAWLIEHAGFARGHRHGGAAISSKHALALVNRDGASTRDIVELAHAIRAAVKGRFGVSLVPEPVFLGFEEEPAGMAAKLPALASTTTGDA